MARQFGCQGGESCSTQPNLAGVGFLGSVRCMSLQHRLQAAQRSQGNRHEFGSVSKLFDLSSVFSGTMQDVHLQTCMSVHVRYFWSRD